MATLIKPPHKVTWSDQQSIFLAGTIDDGQSIDWQKAVEKKLTDLDVLILNPRRDEWDASWKQSIENDQFREQVEWELDGLDKVDHIFMYFAPGSKSPITLLELGLQASGKKIIMICPEGYWRRGNLEVVANRYDIPLYKSLDEGLVVLRSKLT